jgi:hypothetical protein
VSHVGEDAEVSCGVFGEDLTDLGGHEIGPSGLSQGVAEPVDEFRRLQVSEVEAYPDATGDREHVVAAKATSQSLITGEYDGEE